MIKINKVRFLYGFLMLGLAFLHSCATHKAQYGKIAQQNFTITVNKEKPIAQVYLIGNTASLEQSSNQSLALFKTEIEKSNKNATVLFLGNNVDFNTLEIKSNIQNQANLVENFKGKTITIPGNYDWGNGLKGLEEQEKTVNSLIGEQTFLPQNNCGLGTYNISDSIELLAVDSQWYLEDWDKHPRMNDNCNIKYKEDFFNELEKYLDQNQNKITLLAIHHPLISNGEHGGQFSLKKQLYPFKNKVPLPIVGTVINFLRKTGGLNPQDIQHPEYRYLTNRIKTLLENRDNVIVVSSHENSLQFIQKNKIKQIISGSASIAEAARAISKTDFSYGGKGFAVINVYKNGKAIVNYYSTQNNLTTLIFSKTIIEPSISKYTFDENQTFTDSVQAEIYPKELTQKNKSYNFLFGKHYRNYFSFPVNAPIANLSQLKGGLTPVRAGGGIYSNSLTLKDKKGKEYQLKTLKKSAAKFLQTIAFKDQYVAKDFENTSTEDLLLDFYTTTNPYYALIVGDLAKAVNVYQTNPTLYYVPKQNSLAEFNDEFGDQLYMLEETPEDVFKNYNNLKKPINIISTTQLFAKLRNNQAYKIDSKAYIRARLFDMLLGDWDRNPEQWMWAEFKNSNLTTYQPISHYREQIFPKYDGFLLNLFMRSPILKHMQNYSSTIKNVKYLNRENYPLDLAFTSQSTKEDWLSQAYFIKENLSDEKIDDAFKKLIPEVKDENAKQIRLLLKERLKDLEKYAQSYYNVLQKKVILTGTDEEDLFLINRLPKGNTQIQILDKSNQIIFNKTYNKKETKEIWLYALDNKDVFKVTGKPKKPIVLRLLGGHDNDTYKIENGRKVKIYDLQNQNNNLTEAKKANIYLSNDYDINTYEYTKPKYNKITGLPYIGFNPDDGLKIGLNLNYTINNFDRKPFTRKHNLLANYYFATTGYEISYKGSFAKFLGKWYLDFNASFTSPTYSENFFGYGNETQNYDYVLGLDYNRVKTQALRLGPTIYKENKNNGTRVELKTNYEAILVEETPNRYIAESESINPNVFEHQRFIEAGVKYNFINYDNLSNPTLGMLFSAEFLWKTNLANTKNSFPSVTGSLGFTHKLIPSGKLTIATLFNVKYLFNTNFEFYQGANLGGDFSLRSYRSSRFVGKTAYFQSTDLRLEIGKIKAFIPLKYGILSGFDYGRVWMDGEYSQKWHQSYGGGFWINGLNMVTAKVSYFYGSDKERIAFGINFGF